MSGYQFVHVESYARKPNRRGQSAAFIFAEAARRPGACGHVEDPRPPVVVFGKPLDEVEALHDARASTATCVTKTGKARKIRSDQHTLLTVVASHPSLSGKRPEAVAAWQALTISWLRAEWGDRLQAVIRHDDEAHPHLHAVVLPDDAGLRARLLHPGAVAKEQAKGQAIAARHDGRQANRIGDDAYKSAMRSMQDRYFERVGIPSGLARLGPGRRRLDRSAWRAEQAQVEHAATAIAAVDAAEAKTRDLTERGRAIVAKARQAHADAAERARRAVVEADAAEERRRVAERTARQEATGIVAEAERQAERLRSIGSRVGGLWSGFTGLQRRLKVRADERVAAVEERTRLAVRAITSRAEQAVGNELAQAQREIAAARARADVAERQAVEARAARKAAEGEAQRERSGREQAERERDRFRGMWADADNRLQARRSYRD